MEFHPDALIEFRDAAQFYERQVAGLGAAFVAEIERTTKFIGTRPLAGAPAGQGL